MPAPSVDISASLSGFDVSGSWTSALGSGNTLVSRTVSGPGLSSTSASGSFTYTLGSGASGTWSISLTVFQADIGENVTVTDSVSLTAPVSVVRVFDGTSWAATSPYVFDGTNWVQTTAYVFDGTNWVPCV